MDVPNLENSVGPGSRILMDDGKLELTVLDVSPEMVEARVVTGGQLSSHKGVNLPGANLSIPGFTEKDQADLAFGIQQGVDMVAVSFVRIADDIIKVRNRIESLSAQLAATPIIAKIELPEAIKNLHEIIHATDGVMVARGDLGVEMPPASVPTLQKEIILTANRHGKIVITATQMLESMIFSPRPTRAEASDVANAVFDGTDAVMLSGETAAGAYPIESIHMMDLIVRDAENHYDPWGHYHDLPQEADHNDALSITRAARELALDRDVAAIVVFTETGRTALYAAKSRCKVPILAFTPVQQTFQRLSMYWGVTPFLVPYANSVESMIAIVEEASTSLLLLHPGQQIVLISGLPVGAMRQPNFLLLHTIGEDY
jgi:pyruvate kinase